MPVPTVRSTKPGSRRVSASVRTSPENQRTQTARTSPRSEAVSDFRGQTSTAKTVPEVQTRPTAQARDLPAGSGPIGSTKTIPGIKSTTSTRSGQGLPGSSYPTLPSATPLPTQSGRNGGDDLMAAIRHLTHHLSHGQQPGQQAPRTRYGPVYK